MSSRFPDAVGYTVVAVIPHPDDESYSAAGLLAMAAAGGARVVVVAATRGEGGWVRDRSLYGHRDLAELRTEELRAACRELGADEPRFLDWPDGGVESADPGDLSRVLDELAPHLVVTLAADGVYGHRDHVALTRRSIDIVTGVHPRARLLLADFRRGLFAPLAEKFINHAPRLLVDDAQPHDLGLAGDADLTIPLPADIADIKRRTIARHDSQLLSADPVEFLLPGLVDEVCEQERYSCLGTELPDGATSPFAELPR